MKKKCYIAFLMLVLAASVSLTGCKGEGRGTVSEEITNEEEEEKDAEPEKKEREKADQEEENEEDDREKPEVSEKVVPVKAVRGEIRDGMFVNETFGIFFPLTDDMVFMGDSEILETLEADTGFLEEGASASAKEMEDAVGGTLYDAVIYLDGENTNVMLSYENMDATMDGNYLDERRYVKNMKDALEEKSPGQYEIKSQKTVTLGEQQYLRVDLKVKLEESEASEIFYCRRAENYMVCITVTFAEEKRQLAEDFVASLNNEDGMGERENAGGIERGTVEDGYYTNEYFGIRFPITDNMMVMSEKEKDTVRGIGNDYMESEGIASSEQMEKASDGTLYDLAIFLEDGMSNIAVCFEDMDVTNAGVIGLDEERYGKILRFTLSQMESFNYEFREDSNVTLGGKEYYRMDFDVDAMGIEAHQIYVFRREERYMISFIITYQDGMEQQIEDFLASITDV